ncbi:MAG: hypothetical protein Q8898_04315 [Bacillota bacterium]|nr:hypothetical protein [Bacillota bacterium]
MEKKQALSIINIIDSWSHSGSPHYESSRLADRNGSLHDFHQWANRKPLLAGYEVTKPEGDGYFLLFIDWHRNNNFYLVIYAHNKSTTYAELQKTVEVEGLQYIAWKYNPLKRDGKNDQRKMYFKQAFGSLFVNIQLPTTTSEVDAFFGQLFKLCSNRLKADRIVEVFDFE